MSRPSTAAPRPSLCGPDEQGYAPGEPQSSVTELRSGPGDVFDSRALAGALHEVSNALTVVLGWLDAGAQAEDVAKLKAALDVAREHARRGRQLARTAIGAEDDCHCEARGANGLGHFAVMSVRPRAMARNVHLQLTELPDPGVAIDDEAPALQILTNLLLNAIDFSPPGGTIHVALRSDFGSVVFTVSDEGPGVAKERRATLFVEPVSTRRGGAGIGLSHSLRLACEHGGDLRLVPSEEGACFELHWPRVRTTALRPSSGLEADKASLRGARVLVVEDDAAIGSLIELSLEARGAEVLLAAGADALRQVLAGRPIIDAALLDLSPLQGRLGEWLDEIRAQAPDAPLVLVSGHPNGVPEEADGQFAAWVRKPFEMSELLRTLSVLLADREVP